jgi:hypothetical protein
MMNNGDGRIRLLCPNCQRGRIFLAADLFSPTRPLVTLRKACPHCGSNTPLTIHAPPADANVGTPVSSVAQAWLDARRFC